MSEKSAPKSAGPQPGKKDKGVKPEHEEADAGSDAMEHPADGSPPWTPKE